MACVTKRRGRYVIDCYDQNGKRYRKTMKAGATKEDSRKELREIEAKIERRTFLHEKKTPTFKEVAKLWLEYKRTRCRETSWEMYQGHLKNHFSELDDRKINLITTASIEQFITARQSKNMALGTLRKLLVTLNQVMAYAARHRLIDYNPVRDAERPKATGKIDESRDISILTPMQIRGLIEAEPDLKYQTLFLTAIMTGMRQGELIGLKWSDVNFTNKQIHVKRTFNHGRFFEPKTRESIRKIDLSPMLVRELAAWKLKSAGQDDGLVFPSESGTPICCFNMVRRHFSPALKKAGISRIKFHALRHTYASLLIDQKENIKYIQNQLGHSTPNITLSVYAHLMKDENQEAACRLENAIFEGTGHNLVTNEKRG
jgi:integrase